MRKFSLTIILPIVAIVLMKVCGTGHQDEYPYVDYNTVVVEDEYTEKEINVDNAELAEYFYYLEHKDEIDAQQQMIENHKYTNVVCCECECEE